METKRLPEGALGSTVRVCLVQLKSPFFDEMDRVLGGEYERLAFLAKAHAGRMERLRNLLCSLGNSKRVPHLLLLPEYGIHQDAVPLLQDWADRHDSIVIANYYNDAERASTAVVLVGGQKTALSANKIDRSGYDADVLAQAAPGEGGGLRLSWDAPCGDGSKREVHLNVLTCLDFLTRWGEAVEASVPSLVAVPMCSPSMSEFVSQAELLMRQRDRTEGAFKTTVTLLCNASDLKGQAGFGACGRTQVVGPSKRALPEVPFGEEAALFADVNCLAVIQQPTPLPRGRGQGRCENVVVVSPTVCPIGHDGALAGQAPTAHAPVFHVLHPAAPRLAGLSKYYVFVRLRNYYGLRDRLRTSPVGANGIYGFHDLLLHSHEEDEQFLRLRLLATLGDSPDSDIQDYESLEIGRTVKYRGTMFAEFDEASGLFRPGSPDVSSVYVRNHRGTLAAVARGDEHGALSADTSEVAGKGLVLDARGDSDLEEAERESGAGEFLILVLLGDLPIGKTGFREFETEVLRELVRDERVRTAEFSKGGGRGSLRDVNYVIHVVGTLHDVREIVVERVHGAMYRTGVPVSTRVIPVAETLSVNGYPALEETHTDEWQRSQVLPLLEACIGRGDPFCVKRVPENSIQLVSQLWYAGALYYAKRLPDINLRREREGEVGKAVYGIAEGLSGDEHLTGVLETHIKVFCKAFYLDLAEDVETLLTGYVAECVRAVGRDAFCSLLDQPGATRRHARPAAEVLGDTNLGTNMQLVMRWNKHVAGVSGMPHIGDTKLTSELRAMRRLRVEQFRNYFAHGVLQTDPDVTGASPPEFFQSRDEVRTLAESLVAMLRFVLARQFGEPLDNI